MSGEWTLRKHNKRVTRNRNIANYVRSFFIATVGLSMVSLFVYLVFLSVEAWPSAGYFWVIVIIVALLAWVIKSDFYD